MPETTPLIKAALNLRVGAGFDVYFTSGFLTVIMVKPEFKMRRFSPLKTRVKKPKTKGTKADSVEKVTVAELLPSLENTVLNKN